MVRIVLVCCFFLMTPPSVQSNNGLKIWQQNVLFMEFTERERMSCENWQKVGHFFKKSEISDLDFDKREYYSVRSGSKFKVVIKGRIPRKVFEEQNPNFWDLDQHNYYHVNDGSNNFLVRPAFEQLFLFHQFAKDGLIPFLLVMEFDNEDYTP